MRTVRMVTSNDGKAREFGRALEGIDWEVEHVSSPYLELQADTLDEVAWASARYLLEAGSVEPPFFLEDAGLFVSGLGGFPGVYSAYVFMTLGTAGVLRLMEGRKDRSASFESRVALCLEAGEVELLGGSCRGELAEEARGEGGFGYDPIFVPQGHERTFAEMSVEEKGAVSHRGRSAEALRERLSEQAL